MFLKIKDHIINSDEIAMIRLQSIGNGNCITFWFKDDPTDEGQCLYFTTKGNYDDTESSPDTYELSAEDFDIVEDYLRNKFAGYRII